MLLGIFMLVIPEPEKADAPMLVTPSGITIELSLAQAQKAASPMATIELGSVTSEIDEFMNAWSGIFLMPVTSDMSRMIPPV